MVVLKVNAYIKLCEDRGHRTVEQRARAAGIGMGTVSRITRGAPVGSRVMSRLMKAYDAGFDELFETDENRDVRATA